MRLDFIFYLEVFYVLRWCFDELQFIGFGKIRLWLDAKKSPEPICGAL